MKTTDLRLNNWVQTSGDFPMQVVGIYSDVVYLDFEVNEGDIWEEREEDIKGIELTEKILLNSGFKEEYDHLLSIERYRFDNDFIHITMNCTYTNYRKWHIHIDNGDFQTIGGGECDYVHQLQNIVFDVADKDLTIKI